MRDRIDRGNEGFGINKLGLFGSHLAALTGFFDPPYSRPLADLPEDVRGFLLNAAGFGLRAQGRLADAVPPMAAGLKMAIDREAWQNAAISAGHLSELNLTLGDVSAAVDAGARAVDFADQSGEGFQRESKRTAHADALAQAGDVDAAQALFEAAEAMQQERQPNYRYLPSLQGYRYCDLLLDRGRAAAVRERAETTLEWATAQNWLLPIALDHLSLGRALAALGVPDAAGHLDAAVDGLRDAGVVEFITRGLLARAEFRREGDDRAGAERDLAEALELAVRMGARLFEADAHLGFARLRLDQGREDDARTHFETAKRLVEETGYHRRDGALAELAARLT